VVWIRSIDEGIGEDGEGSGGIEAESKSRMARRRHLEEMIE